MQHRQSIQGPVAGVSPLSAHAAGLARPADARAAAIEGPPEPAFDPWAMWLSAHVARR